MTKNEHAVDDPVLARFLAALDQEYGTRLARVVLYGSRARGESTPDSDYDIAVFLKDSAGLWSESEHLAAIEIALLRDTGAVINALAFSAETYGARTPLMHELRRDGIEL